MSVWPSMFTRDGVWVLYVAAAGAVVTVAAVSATLEPVLHHVPTAGLVAAVLLVAWFGGLGPALFATGEAAVLLAVLPPYDASQRPLAHAVGIALFVAVSVAISFLASTRRRVERERQALLERERTARAEAERLSRHKDDFLAVVSHELRSPLTAILGWVAVIRRAAKDDGEIQRAIATIERNTRLQARLVGDLLDIARIVEGKLELDRERADVTSLVGEIVDSYRPDALRRNVALEYVVARSAPEPVYAPVDVQRIEQVVGNLLSNAIKFTPSGGDIRVSLERAEDRVRIVVSDSGPGIDPDVLPHVFDKFRQGAGARAHGGLGLGLAIVKHLVALHGGTVCAVSDGHRGTTFVIELPTSDHPRARLGDRSAHPPAAAAAP